MRKTIKIALTGLFGLLAYFVTFAPLLEQGKIVIAETRRKHATETKAFVLSTSKCHLGKENGRVLKGLKVISHWETARSLTAAQSSSVSAN